MQKTILVVEDDEDVQEALLLMLELEGYETRAAVDGHEALQHVQTWRPDLILLDLMLPRMNGYEFVAELERLHLRQSVRILVLTADADARLKATKVGADSSMVKPFDLDTLLAEVERLLAS